jgi:hypothetical protein
MEVIVNECKFINFSVTHKPIHEECATSAQQTISYKEASQEFYFRFNIKKMNPDEILANLNNNEDNEEGSADI